MNWSGRALVTAALAVLAIARAAGRRVQFPTDRGPVGRHS